MQLFDRGGDGTPRVASGRVLTIPNVLSLARLLVLPWLYALIVDERYLFALAVGFVFAGTDWVDGYLARKLDQVTRLGRLLDPVSDRLFIVVVLVAMVVVRLVPWWLAATLVLRDVALVVAGAVVLGGGGHTPPVTRLGKATTFGLMWAFPLLLVAGHLQVNGASAGDVVRGVGLAVAAVAAVLYWVVAVSYARHLWVHRAGTG